MTLGRPAAMRGLYEDFAGGPGADLGKVLGAGALLIFIGGVAGWYAAKRWG